MWLKAFGLVPAAAMRGAVPAQPPDTTGCPYPQAAALDKRNECNDFRIGKCQRGEQCKFKHVEAGDPASKRQKADFAKDSREWISQVRRSNNHTPPRQTRHIYIYIYVYITNIHIYIYIPIGMPGSTAP